MKPRRDSVFWPKTRRRGRLAVADHLVRTIDLACPVDHAFEIFTGQIDLWWPRGHRKDADAAMVFDGKQIIERAADGREWTMGRVAEIDPPRFLALDWFPGSPAAPTSVEIRFAENASGTTITVTHRALSAEAETIWPQ